MNLSSQNAPATPRQLIALFYGTGLNTKGMTITVGTASNLISDMKAGIDITDDLRRYGATGEPKKKKSSKDELQELFDRADKAGMEAVEKLSVVPMVVESRVNPIDDNSPVNQSWFVGDGVCGFAWVVIKPANSAFAKFLVEKKLASKHYDGGVSMWVGQFNQSMQKKEAYAYAFAKVVQEANIKAYAGSRMD